MGIPLAVSPSVRTPGLALLINLLATVASPGTAPLRACNVADNEGRNLRKNLGQVGGVYAKLGTKGEAAKAFQKLGLDPSKATGDIQKNLAAVLKVTGSDKDKLTRGGFDDSQASFLMEMAKNAKAAGGLEAALAAAGKSSETFAGVEAQAASRMQGAQAQMDQAMEKLKVAFSNPAFIKSLTSLMSRLPAAVDKIVKVVEFAADNPYTAAAGGAAAVAGKGMLGVGADAAMTAGAATLRAALGLGGAKAAGNVGDAMATGGKGAATAIAESGGLLGKAFVGVAAFGLGYAIAKAGHEIWKEHANREQKARDDELAASSDGVVRNKTGDKALVWKRDEKGMMHAEEVSGEEADNWQAKNHNARAELYSAGALGGGWKAPMALPDGAFNFMADNGGSGAGGGRAPAAPPQRSAADARLLADMLGSRELKVRITNPEAISGKTGPGSPAPGYDPR